MEISTENLRRLAAYSGDPWTPTNRYFRDAEPVFAPLWDRIIWPFISECDFSCVLDLAAGHGRNSAMLLPHVSDVLYISDIQAGNVEACAARFSTHPKVRTFIGTGYDFSPLPDASLSMIYCFDAMVHFDSDVVRQYLRDSLRVLKPGGSAFYHHSNYTGGDDWKVNPASRNFMSEELFRHYALKEGLTVVTQKVINWGKHVNHDCLTLVRRER